MEASALLFVLTAFVIMPIADLLTGIAGYIVCQSATEQIARQAARQTSFPAVLISLCQTSKISLELLPLKLLKTEPEGGFQSSGADIFIQETNVYTNAVKLYPANILPPSINPSNCIYEAVVKTAFKTQPVFPLAFLDSVPGLGRPMELNFSALEPIENINSFRVKAQNVPYRGGVGLGGNSAAWLGSASLYAWSYPFFRWMQGPPGKPGAQQLSSMTVYAANAEWTDTGFDVHKGESFSCSSVPRQWQYAFEHDAFAFGIAGTIAPNGFREAALLMKIGEKGAPFYAPNSEVCLMPESGRVYLKCNDFRYSDNALFQTFAMGPTP